VVVGSGSHPNKLIPLFLGEEVVHDSVNECCVPSFGLSTGGWSVERSENVLDLEGMYNTLRKLHAKLGILSLIMIKETP
jgi:hypothetical protein